MDDLISRVAAIEAIVFNSEGKFAVDVLNDVPAMDAVPVVHGRWVICEDRWGDTQYQCSACGDEWTLIDGTPKEYEMNYCPHCGAKMDGGENDGEA